MLLDDLRSLVLYLLHNYNVSSPVPLIAVLILPPCLQPLCLIINAAPMGGHLAIHTSFGTDMVGDTLKGPLTINKHNSTSSAQCLHHHQHRENWF